MKKLRIVVRHIHDEYLCPLGRGVWMFLGLIHIILIAFVGIFLGEVVKKLDRNTTASFIGKRLPLWKLFFIGWRRAPLSSFFLFIGLPLLSIGFIPFWANQLKLACPDTWIFLTCGLFSYGIALWWALTFCREGAEDGSLYRSRKRDY